MVVSLFLEVMVMDHDDMKAAAEERRKLLASRGINVRIRAGVRAERTPLEEALLARSGWIGRAADLNRSPEEVDEALEMVDKLTERIAILEAET